MLSIYYDRYNTAYYSRIKQQRIQILNGLKFEMTRGFKFQILGYYEKKTNEQVNNV